MKVINTGKATRSHPHRSLLNTLLAASCCPPLMQHQVVIFSSGRTNHTKYYDTRTAAALFPGRNWHVARACRATAMARKLRGRIEVVDAARECRSQRQWCKMSLNHWPINHQYAYNTVLKLYLSTTHMKVSSITSNAEMRVAYKT